MTVFSLTSTSARVTHARNAASCRAVFPFMCFFTTGMLARQFSTLAPILAMHKSAHQYSLAYLLDSTFDVFHLCAILADDLACFVRVETRGAILRVHLVRRDRRFPLEMAEEGRT